MEMNNSQVMYNEVFEFLNIIGKKYIDRIPKSLYEFIREQRVENYNIIIDIEQDVYEQISEDALAFISYLNFTYWCNEEERNKLIKVYIENDKKEEKLKREKYNPNNIFNKKNINKSEEYLNVKEESLENIEVVWYKKISNRIRNIFKLIFNKKINK